LPRDKEKCSSYLKKKKKKAGSRSSKLRALCIESARFDSAWKNLAKRYELEKEAPPDSL